MLPTELVEMNFLLGVEHVPVTMNIKNEGSIYTLCQKLKLGHSYHQLSSTACQARPTSLPSTLSPSNLFWTASLLDVISIHLIPILFVKEISELANRMKKKKKKNLNLTKFYSKDGFSFIFCSHMSEHYIIHQLGMEFKLRLSIES